jgi:cytidylate kinase
MRPTMQMMQGDSSPFIGGVAVLPDFPRVQTASRVHPFITISRQSGAGGSTLAAQLVERLNVLDPAPHPWRMWNRDLVQEVATRHKVPAALVESVDERTRNWLEDMLANLSTSESPSEEAVYKRVAATIHALAQAGRAVIVGRGGVLITHGLSKGIHLRLVAPLEHRVALTAWRLRISMDAAGAEVRRQDAEREQFYKRYWGISALLPEHFTLSMNTAALQVEQMVSCIIAGMRQDLPQEVRS